MTLSVLMYAMVMVSLVTLVGVLFVDAVRGVLRRSAHQAPRSVRPAAARSAASRAHNRSAVPTRS
jgi:hypothetical protein